MAVVRWTFYDPITLDEYEFVVNPSEGGSPSYNKSITYEKTTAPDGMVVVMEGREDPRKLEFSGTLFSQQEFTAFVTWYEKHYQIQMTDDLGREFHIMIDSFEPKRERAIHYPWKHSYTVSATIIDTA